MKKSLLFLTLLSALCIFFTSCKKDPIIIKDKCVAQHKPCNTPWMTGMIVYDQGIQVGTHIYDIYPSYSNPGQDSVGNINYYVDSDPNPYTYDNHLIHTDQNDPGNQTHAGNVFTIVVPPADASFTITGIGSIKRCDCDSIVKSYTISQSMTNTAISYTDGKVTAISSDPVLLKQLVQKIKDPAFLNQMIQRIKIKK